VYLVRLVDFNAKTPLIGMLMVFIAMLIVAVTAYQRAGWYSLIGYAVAAAVAVFGFVFTFRDIPTPPHDNSGRDSRS
jgi:amino acid transporter